MQLRHKSPLGHGFDGVSLEAIRDRVAGFSPERLGEIIRAAGLSGDKNNPFDRVNILIAKALGWVDLAKKGLKLYDLRYRLGIDSRRMNGLDEERIETQLLFYFFLILVLAGWMDLTKKGLKRWD